MAWTFLFDSWQHLLLFRSLICKTRLPWYGCIIYWLFVYFFIYQINNMNETVNVKTWSWNHLYNYQESLKWLFDCHLSDTFWINCEPIYCSLFMFAQYQQMTGCTTMRHCNRKIIFYIFNQIKWLIKQYWLQVLWITRKCKSENVC